MGIYNLKLDYLSAKLNLNFTKLQFEEWAGQEYLDQRTGLIAPNARPKNSYDLDFRGGKHVIARTFNGAELRFAPIVERERLIVTRIDLAVDIFSRNTYSTCLELVEAVEEAYRNRNLKVSKGYWSSPDGQGGTTHTWTFQSRKSEFQVRIYTKQNLARAEFQMRSKTARAVWSAMRKNHADLEHPKEFWECTDCILSAYKTVESRKLADNIISGKAGSRLNILFGEETSKPRRVIWMETQVLPAVLKEYRETGENLAEYLIMLFKKAIGGEDQNGNNGTFETNDITG